MPVLGRTGTSKSTPTIVPKEVIESAHNVLVLTDSSAAQVKFGDYTLLGKLVGENEIEELAGGYIDATGLHPPLNRDFRIWQVSLYDLFVAGKYEFGRIFEEYFGVSRSDFRHKLKFDVVYVHAGTDFLARLLYTIPAAEESKRQPTTIVELIEEQIAELCSTLPGKPPIVVGGFGFAGRDIDPEHIGLCAHSAFPAHDGSKVESYRVYDQALTQLHRVIAFGRAKTGVFGSHRPATGFWCFLAGRVSRRKASNGRGQPFAADLANVARVLIGGLCGAL